MKKIRNVFASGLLALALSAGISLAPVAAAAQGKACCPKEACCKPGADCCKGEKECCKQQKECCKQAKSCCRR